MAFPLTTYVTFTFLSFNFLVYRIKVNLRYLLVLKLPNSVIVFEGSVIKASKIERGGDVIHTFEFSQACQTDFI